MKEYGSASLVKHESAKGIYWRGLLYWRESDADEWHRLSKVLTDESGEKISARPGKDDNRGKATAEKALTRWRDELIAADKTAEQDAAETIEKAKRDAERISVADYVDQFIEARAALQSVEPSTMRGYRKIAKLIRAEFAETAMQDLTRSMVEAFEVKLLNGERLACDDIDRTRNTGAVNTVRKAHIMLKAACAHAADVDEIIVKNPCASVKPPKLAAPKKNAMDERSRARFAEYAATRVPTEIVTGAALALWASLGPGEACGLKWRNIDLDNLMIHVDSAIGEGEGGSYVKEPKAKARKRTIPIIANLADVLTRRRKLCEAECADVGIELSPDMYVLGGVDGRYFEPLRLSRGWSAISDAEGYTGTVEPHVRLYDLRHTFGAVAVASHVDIEAVSALMGHSSVSMTLNVYASALPEAKAAAAGKIEAAYGTFSDGGR